MHTKRAIYVDYSGVYELYRHPREYGMSWPKEWGSDRLTGRYYPNPQIYEMVREWRTKGVLVNILTGGSSVESSDGWPTEARPEQAFDGVYFGNKSYAETFRRHQEYAAHQGDGEIVRCCLVDDSLPNLAVANSAGWDTYIYDPILASRSPGESIVRLCFQNTIAVSEPNSS